MKNEMQKNERGVNSMYYDYPEEEFYTESDYQEQIDALKVAIKNSVKSEILEEMNRLRAENERLQGIKEHFEEVKRDYEKKKDECDRIARNAEYNAKKMRLADLMKDHKVIKWKVSWELVYGPKCDKCDSTREIEIKLPSGNIVKDSCGCKTDSKRYYYPKRYILSEFTDRYGDRRITAHYSEESSYSEKDTYYELCTYTVCDKYTEDRKKEAIESLSDEVRDILFNEEEECQKVCDKLNEGLGNFLYKNNGENVKEYLEMEKE